MGPSAPAEPSEGGATVRHQSHQYHHGHDYSYDHSYGSIPLLVATVPLLVLPLGLVPLIIVLGQGAPLGSVLRFFGPISRLRDRPSARQRGIRPLRRSHVPLQPGHLRPMGQIRGADVDRGVPAVPVKQPRLGVKAINGKELLAATKLPDLGGAEQTLADYVGPQGLMLLFADTSCPYSNVAIKELSGVALTLEKAALIRTVVVNITDSEDKVRAYYAICDL